MDCTQCGAPLRQMPTGQWVCPYGHDRGGFPSPLTPQGQQIRGTLPPAGQWLGWSVNLSLPGTEHCFEVTFPVPPIFETSMGLVMEVVFWADLVERWIHGVSQHFAQGLPAGHVQIAVGDLEWVGQCAAQGGRDGLIHVVQQLEGYQRGIHAPPAH